MKTKTVVDLEQQFNKLSTQAKTVDQLSNDVYTILNCAFQENKIIEFWIQIHQGSTTVKFSNLSKDDTFELFLEKLTFYINDQNKIVYNIFILESAQNNDIMQYTFNLHK